MSQFRFSKKYKIMTLNPNYDQIGKAFTQQYYMMFDNAAQRAGLITLYNVRSQLRNFTNFFPLMIILQAEQSLMTFEGNQVQGSRAIMEKIGSLSFQKIAHIITTVDCQPTFDGGILINVLGQLKVSQLSVQVEEK